jgi:sigma-E factor negative regulatory protein RseB
MAMWRIWTAGALLLLGFHTHGLAGDDVQIRAWLEKMFQASRSLSYDGVFVYQKGAHIDVMRLIRSVDATGEHERLMALTGPARELIRTDNMVTCILPQDHTAAIGIRRAYSSFLSIVPQHYELLQGLYRFTLGGEERVAGQSVREIMIEPKDQHRYGYRLWLDTQTGLLLKSQLMDSNHRPLEQVMFTSIEVLDRVPPDLLKPASHGAQLTWQISEQAPQLSSTQGWKVSWLPAGFSLSAHETRRPPKSQTALEHMVFSDGLASLSVFIEAGQESSMPLGVSQRGAVNTYTRRVGDFFVTVVGEAPATTIKQIGESIEFLGSSG